MPFDYGDDLLNTGLYEFSSTFSADTGDATAISSGSGVHIYKDIRINLNILDRDEGNIFNENTFLASAFTSKIDIDIIDISGNDIKTGYLVDYKNTFFTFNELENINVFGDYAKHFGIRTKLQGRDSLENQSEFYFYGNTPSISGVAVKDGTGVTFHSGSLSNKSGINTTGQTGQVSLTVTFDNDMSYVKMTDLDVFITTGSGFDSEQLFPDYTAKINQLGIQTFSIDEAKFEENSGDYYLHLVPNSEIGSGVAWTVGPNRVIKQPFSRNPYATIDEAVLVFGEQSISGEKTFNSKIKAPNLTLTGLSNQGSEATALFINGSNEVGFRELGAAAFSSSAGRTVTAGGNTLDPSETLAFTAGLGIQITESAGAVTIASPSGVASDDVNFIVKLTQAEYDAITPDSNTLYFISDESTNSPVVNPIKTVTNNYTITDTDHTVLVSGAASTNITLPSAVNNSNYVYNIKNLTTEAVNISSTVGSIDLSSSETINSRFESMTVQSDGSNWHII